MKAKKDYDEKKLSKVEIEKLHLESGSLIKFLVEFVQRKRGRELERTKIKVKYGEKYGEVILLEDHAFIIHDIDAKEKEVSKARIKSNGSLEALEKANLEEMEKHIANIHILPKVFIKEPIFEDLKKIFVGILLFFTSSPSKTFNNSSFETFSMPSNLRASLAIAVAES